MAIKFRLREMMARKARLSGKKCTYETIRLATGISPNTLSGMTKGKMKQVGLPGLDRLAEHLGCEIGELMVRDI